MAVHFTVEGEAITVEAAFPAEAKSTLRCIRLVVLAVAGVVVLTLVFGADTGAGSPGCSAMPGSLF